MPLIKPGDDVAELILRSVGKQGLDLEDGDVIVLAQSVVSKAEGKVVDLTEVEPTNRAREIAEGMDDDPRKIQVILDETEEIVRLEHVLISRTRHGFVCADAGVDASNVEPGRVTVLPDDPDEGAREIRERIERETGSEVAVVISDSWGRPFRLGAVGFAIGIAGMNPIQDLRGMEDSYGREMKTTKVATPDLVAAAASLEMGEAGEGVPAVILRDVPYGRGMGSISKLIRSREMDLFR